MNSIGEGVIYAPRHYLGFGRRMLIDLIDGCVILAYWGLVFLRGDMVLPYEWTAAWQLAYWAGPVGYLVLLKRSRFRTLGYHVAGARIVNLQGEVPGIRWMLLRLIVVVLLPVFFAVIGPVAMFCDFLWSGCDATKQSLHDKLARTYVVRSYAQPKGRGRIRLMLYGILGSNFIFQEVVGE